MEATEAFLSHFEVKPGVQIGDVLLPKLAIGNLKLLELE